MEYHSYTLSNGIRVIIQPDDGAISYCGVVINVGSRDEEEHQYGMAHLIEHMLFKGTEKRNSRHIINRLEDIGGELNAFTSKEETVIYTTVLNEYTERALELLADVVFHSTFQQKEIDKEVEVILDEIQSYSDSPSELIFDDFEELLFENNPLAHNILGDASLLPSFNTNTTVQFQKHFYSQRDIVLFVVGNLPMKKLNRWIDKYFQDQEHNKQQAATERSAPLAYLPKKIEVIKQTHQVHVLMGCPCYNMHDEKKLPMLLLNNIIGGQGMNSLLNLSLREKHGLVYQVESNYQALTDAGLWNIYFACDNSDLDKCKSLISRDLKKLREQKIPDRQLSKYKLQFMGQLAIANEIKESKALGLAKSFLHFDKVDDLNTIRKFVEAINSEQLINIANEMFEENRLSFLQYH